MISRKHKQVHALVIEMLINFISIIDFLIFKNSALVLSN